MNINMTFAGGQGKIKFNMDNLIRLQDAMKKNYATRVGIIGSAEHEPRKIAPVRREAVQIKSGKNAGKNRAGKEASEMTNAAIGALHEKGSADGKHPPRRSWLELPIYTHLEDEKDALRSSFYTAIRNFDLKFFAIRVGIIAEGVVQTGFETSGWGSWPKLVVRQGKPLIDTGQLRKAVTSAVVTK